MEGADCGMANGEISTDCAPGTDTVRSAARCCLACVFGVALGASAGAVTFTGSRDCDRGKPHG